MYVLLLYLLVALAGFMIAFWMDRRPITVKGMRLHNITRQRWLTAYNPRIYGTVVLLIIFQCGAGNYGGGTMACQIQPDAPHISHGEYRKHGRIRITAKVRYQCREPMLAHQFKIRLQFKRKVGWRTMATISDNRIPPPTGGKLTKRVDYDGCKTGRWRVRVNGSAQSKKGESGKINATGTGNVDCSDVPKG